MVGNARVARPPTRHLPLCSRAALLAEGYSVQNLVFERALFAGRVPVGARTHDTRIPDTTSRINRAHLANGTLRLLRIVGLNWPYIYEKWTIYYLADFKFT